MSTSKAQTKKERLLEAAGRVFVEKAFRDATVAEICDLAGANIASVNYYFGGKEALYKETWRHSLTESLKAYPIDGGVPASAPAEERLRGQLVSLIRRFSDEKSIDFLIARMEMVNPTGLLEEVMASELGPVRRQTLALVRELLGPGDWAQVRRAAAVGHDNPRRTAEADLRAHACVLVTEAFALRPPFEEIRYPAGRYAVMLLRGPCDQLPEAGRGFIEDWLAASGEVAAGPAPYEVYLNDPRDTAPADLLTEVRLPLV